MDCKVTVTLTEPHPKYNPFTNTRTINVQKGVDIDSTIIIPDKIQYDEKVKISGILTEKKTGAPVSGVKIHSYISFPVYNRGWYQHHVRFCYIETNKDGSWSIEHDLDFLPANDYKFNIGLHEHGIYNTFNKKIGLTIVKADVNSTIQAPDSAFPGEKIKIGGTLKETVSGKVVSGIQLNVNVDGEIYNPKTDKNGDWSIECSAPIRVGNNEVTVTLKDQKIKYNNFCNTTIITIPIHTYETTLKYKKYIETYNQK